MPPPTAIRPVTHVISIPRFPYLVRAVTACPANPRLDAKVLVCCSSAAQKPSAKGRHEMDFILKDRTL
jgi:hypothetical protein